MIIIDARVALLGSAFGLYSCRGNELLFYLISAKHRVV